MSADRSVLRLEAALYEIGRTLTYPAMPDPTDAILAAVAEREARRPRPAVRVGRPLLVATLIVLVLAGVAAAAYLISTAWLSTGPRGIQFSDEFTFAEVYRERGLPVEPGPLPHSVSYADFAISHDGSAIYAVRTTSPERAATLVRLTGLDEPTLQREEVLDYAELTDPALWDPGFDASAVDIGILLFNSDDDTFAVAPDGQLFLAAAAYGRERMPLPYAEEQEAELRANWSDITDAEIEQLTTRQPIVSATLIVVRPDGSRQKVLTIAELVAAGLLTTDGAEASITVAASAADRLWAKSEVFGEEASGRPYLFQVVDPDGDGDWSNRVVLPLALPESIPPPAAVPRPGDEPRESWFYRQPTAEISTSRVDRSRSFLLPMLSTTGEYRIYRVSDTNADGDARDSGESQLVLTGQPGFGDSKWPTVTSRVVVDGGNEVLRELLVSSLTRSTRLSRVLEDGSVRDIARAIEWGPEDVVAEPDGDIDIVVQGSRGAETGSAFTIYRLTPVPIGEAGASASPGEASAPPSSSAAGFEALERLFAEFIFPYRVPIGIGLALALSALAVLAWRRRWDRPLRRHPRRTLLAVVPLVLVLALAGWFLGSSLLTPVPIGEAGATASPGDASSSPSSSAGGLETLTAGEPRIAYTLESWGEQETAQIMVVGADGSGPTELIPGEHNSYFCQSADGSLIGFWSDAEVPHESFVYVANADGTGRRKISEDIGQFWCGFSGDTILVQGRAESAPILRHDLATGEETELLSGADRLEASPDGRRYLAAIGGAGGATLEVLDATSGERLTLHGPLAEGRIFVWSPFAWAPDGLLVTYAIGPAPTSQGPQTSGRYEIYVVDPAGGEPRLVYSLDGYEPRFALSADARHLLVRAPSQEPPGEGPLVLVEVETGEARTLATDAVFGDWHPSQPATFAYATAEALYITTTGGEAREVIQVPPEGICPDCEGGGAPPGEWGWGDWMGWSPDGRYIGLPDFAPVLAVIEVETGDLRILTGDVADEAFITGARWLR